MAKKGQGELIDTAPKNARPIDEKARQYYATVRKRLAVQEEEKYQKNELYELLDKSGLQKLENGDIVYNHEGVNIVLNPSPVRGKLTVRVDDGTDE